ncbi:hypothetical protein AAC387_Pa12g1414 [Persea americana]
MFYSQFILAKKGPLGTIWIAAHLERKLRKNQVADTDIGVSVDSILFPEVPIALRLSSHLLLGVVRIYSRKVNYLFHDCSEALLKIKQAFRSTAVDLPPEESTAPYHSITLPETFDLDDFELPDNAFFQGNYVDHHVSTREQITLQDTMEGMVYSTSQFGLDERFGDGDASQIGLDLDEELFLEKIPPSDHPSAPLGFGEDADPQTSGQQPVTPAEMDIDGVCEDHIDSNILDSNTAEGSSYLHDDHIYTPDLNDGLLPCEPCEGPIADPSAMDFAYSAAEVLSSDLTECAHAPSTPGLMMEAVPSLSLLKKTSLNFVGLESVATDSTKLIPDDGLSNPLNGTDYHIEGTQHALNCASLNDKSCETDILPAQNMEIESSCGIPRNMLINHTGNGLLPPVGMISSDMIHSVSSPTSVLSEPKPICPAPECPNSLSSDEHSLKCGQDRIQILENGAPCSGVSSIPIIDPTHNAAEAVEPQADPLVVTTLSPGCTDESSSLQTSCDRPLDGVATVPAFYVSAINGQPSSEGSPAIKSLESVKHNNNTGLELLANGGPVGAVEDSCPSHAALPSDTEFQFGSTDEQEVENPCACTPVLQACSSSMNQSNALPLEDNVDAHQLSSTEVRPCAIEAQENLALDVDIASTELHGEGCCLTNITDANLDMQQMGSPSSKIRSCLDGVASKDNHLGTINSPTSEFPAPETLLLAPTEVSDVPNDLALQSTSGKPVKEGETVDRFDSVSGKKRRTMESTPELDNRLSGMTRSIRSLDCIPNDDDVLASILVGKTPFLKVRPTPPPPEVISSKRSRVTTRVNVSKRKVLLDDTMVLHGDVIRKQLTNTEDIRRIRRKAPCTRKEIWMIQKYLLEEEIFTEPLFNDMSKTLSGLHNQTYDLTETGVNHIDVMQSPSKTPEELGLSRRAELVQETVVEGIDGSIAIPDKNVVAAREPTEAVVQVENHSSDHASSSLGSDQQERREVAMATDMLENGGSGDVNPAAVRIEMPEEGTSNDVYHAFPVGDEMPHPGDDGNVSADVRIKSSSMDKSGGTLTTHQNDNGACVSPSQELPIVPGDGFREMNDGKLHLSDNAFIEKDVSITEMRDCAIGTIEINHETLTLDKGIEGEESVFDEAKGNVSVDVVPPSLPQDLHDDVKEIANDEISDPLLDNCSIEAEADVLMNSLTTDPNMNLSVPDVAAESEGLTDMAIVTDDKGTAEIMMLGTVVEDECVAKEVTVDEHDPSSTGICIEGLQGDSCPLQLNSDMEHGPSNGEVPGCQESSRVCAMDTEMPVTTVSAEGDSGDFGYILDDNDTEFLNVDDDEAEPVEEEDNNTQTAEEDQFIDNSGWSSRTRAVARYLRSLFDNESGRGMKMVPVDNLLAGKTRKEASRMFFETLVLKTKDYIHVEQENPFVKINIQPRAKLMKSEF